MSQSEIRTREGNAILLYYRRLREALVEAKRQPELQQPKFVHGVETVLRNLGELIFDREPPKNLEDIRKLDPELRDGAILFLIDKDLPGSGDALEWYSDRLYELGGWERVLSDPKIRTVGDLIEIISDVEPWSA
ncbi:MAG: hypothetical protein HY236_17665 [Acidobacteria bacterium]|nr:hypothetical protein [Acidobacteriota bacterium]